jgi:iron-sulfur cluster repair protein YtfE (RIC family)
MNTSYWPIHSVSSPTSVASKLNAFWQNLLAHLDSTTEPRVWEAVDASGKTLWNAYDPISQMAIDHASADELSTWLEELHYRS